MSEDRVIPWRSPGTPGPVADTLTELLREGARRMLAVAIEAEVEVFLSRFHDEKTASGQRRVVRNGHLPERSIQTGIGPVAVSVPRVRDRAGRSGSRRRSCRPICGARGRWRRCCPGCI